MKEDFSILMYQTVDDSERFTFSNPVLKELREKFPSVPLFHIDSISEAQLFQYAEKLLQKEKETLFIVLNKSTGKTPRNLGRLLQLAIKNDQVKILSLHSNPMIDKLQKIEVADNEKSLIELIAKQLSS